MALLAVGAVLLVLWAGNAIAAQASELAARLPRAEAALQHWLQGTPLGERVLDAWGDLEIRQLPWARVLGAAGLVLGAVGDTAVVVLLAAFMAAEPAPYLHGALRLLPVAKRDQVGAALRECGQALRGWLKGQAVSMLFVGVATTLGLLALGAPLAFLLGVIAAVLDFIPFFGPIASGALAVLIAFTDGPDTALYVALLALAIQQVEGHLLVPLVQRWAVQLPPALGILGVLLAGGLFGVTGVVFATPLLVATMVLVRTLYVEDALEGGHARD
jgi:predicted PurR-regulated permease PerM